jgi:hypothetical protein
VSNRGALESVGTATTPTAEDYAAAEVEAAFLEATAEERKSAPPPRAHLYVADDESGETHALGLMPLATPIITMDLELPAKNQRNPDVFPLSSKSDADVSSRQHIFSEDPNELLATIARSKNAA